MGDEDYLIFGAGVVGLATQAFFGALGVQCELVDCDPARVAELRGRGLRVQETPHAPGPELTAIICVPTPVLDAEAGHDLSAVLAAVRSAAQLEGVFRLTVVIRSTLPPGACAGIVSEVLAQTAAPACETAVVYMPEFLRKATAQADALNPRAVVIASDNEAARARLTSLCAPFSDRIVELEDPAEGEMIKITQNAFNSAKISFWNEMFRVGAVRGLDMNAVAAVVARTAEASWNPAYGIRGGAPFAGGCLPKDLAGLIAFARAGGVEPSILDAVQAVNQREASEPGRGGDR